MEWQLFEEDEKVDQEILNSDVMTEELFTPEPELLERLEHIRKRLFYGSIILGVVIGGAFITGTIIKLVRMDDELSQWIYSGLMFGAMFFIILIAGAFNGRNRFRKEVKELLIFPMLKNHFSNLTYSWDGVWTMNDISKMGLLRTESKYRSEDHISADYQGIHFEQAEVQSMASSTVDCFRGRIIVLTNPAWSGMHQVKIYSKGFDKRDIPLGFKRIEMENVEFNQLFDVYSDSSHHAFYVLTPQIMERMAEFGRRYQRLAFRLTDGKMYVGVDQIARDAFEVNLHKPLDYNRIRGNISIDVQVIKDLIDVMKIEGQKTDSIIMSDI